jgi:hypothetical protein
MTEPCTENDAKNKANPEMNSRIVLRDLPWDAVEAHVLLPKVVVLHRHIRTQPVIEATP